MSQQRIIREQRNLEPFTKLILEDVGKLYLTQSDSVHLEVEAEEDVLKLIRTEVENGQLRIQIKEPWLDRVARFFVDAWQNSPIVYRLSVVDLEQIRIIGAGTINSGPLQVESVVVDLSGAGRIEFEELYAARCRVNISGAGKVKAVGEIVDQEIRITGAGKFYGLAMKCERCGVVLSGTGKAVVNVQDELKLNITGVGKVEYYGSPKLSQRISGIGKVERMGAVT
jgi:hypothetical protein